MKAQVNGSMVVDYNNKSVILTNLKNPGTTFVTERISNIFADFLPRTCWIIPTSYNSYSKKINPIVFTPVDGTIAHITNRQTYKTKTTVAAC